MTQNNFRVNVAETVNAASNSIMRSLYEHFEDVTPYEMKYFVNMKGVDGEIISFTDTISGYSFYVWQSDLGSLECTVQSPYSEIEGMYLSDVTYIEEFQNFFNDEIVRYFKELSDVKVSKDSSPDTNSSSATMPKINKTVIGRFVDDDFGEVIIFHCTPASEDNSLLSPYIAAHCLGISNVTIEDLSKESFYEDFEKAWIAYKRGYSMYGSISFDYKNLDDGIQYLYDCLDEMF